MRSRLIAVTLMLAAVASGQDPVLVDIDLVGGRGHFVPPQGTIGELPELKWLAGTPVKLIGDGAVKFTLACCYPNLTALRQDLDHMEDLQRRFRDKPVQVVAVLAGAVDAAAVAALKPGVPVAHDPETAVTTMLLGQNAPYHLCVIDQGGSLLVHGEFAWGLGQIVERIVGDKILGDKFDAAQERRDFEIRIAIESDLAEVPAREGLAAIETLVQHNPHDGLAWGMKYLVHATRLLDAEAARTTLQKALAVLATDPAPLGKMADLVLRGEASSKTLGRELVPALTPAAAQAPRDTALQLALLRALVRAGVGREVGRLSRVLAKPAGEDGAMALALAEILASDSTPQAHVTTAQKALEQANGVDPRLLAAVRYAVTLKCADDKAGAQKLATEYMEQHGGHVSLNNDAWYMMTQVRTMGRGNLLAMALCEKMLEDKDKLDSFEYDTVALSMFLNGRVQEAVELQTTALEKGGGSDPDAYRERLQRFQAALDKTAGKDATKDAGKDR